MKNERMIILNHDNFSNSQRGKKYWNSSDSDLILVSQDFFKKPIKIYIVWYKFSFDLLANPDNENI